MLNLLKIALFWINLLDQTGLQIDYEKVQKILTTATFDEANQSVFDMKENFFLGDQAMQQINMNKQMQVVKYISQYYLFFPLMYKDFYFNFCALYYMYSITQYDVVLYLTLSIH